MIYFLAAFLGVLAFLGLAAFLAAGFLAAGFLAALGLAAAFLGVLAFLGLAAFLGDLAFLGLAAFLGDLAFLGFLAGFFLTTFFLGFFSSTLAALKDPEAPLPLTWMRAFFSTRDLIPFLMNGANLTVSTL